MARPQVPLRRRFRPVRRRGAGLRRQRDPYFLGSEHFAREYVASPPAHKYKCGVLVDMVGDAQLQIFREVNSMRTLPTRQLVADIWGVARDLGVKEFVAVTRYEVRDDHLALNNIARIPTIDIIDFEYPTARGPTTGTRPRTCPRTARPSRWPKSAGSSRPG